MFYNYHMRLSKGDTIGIIALSGECDRKKIEQSKAYLESFGYKVKLSKNIYNKKRYLAGSDDDKINELHHFFEDKDIKLILAARGGYGAIRLINRIDYDLIKKNPKPICGFSDATALLLMIYKKTGLITYHSPMAQVDFAISPEEKTFTTENFFKSINTAELTLKAVNVYRSGNAEGIIWGGNLSTVVSLCGLDFIPDKDFIFFTEDVNEPVYKIDKMFTQLMNITQFKMNCKGIVLGDFTGVDNEEWLKEFFEEMANNLEIPMISCRGITHNDNKITLPIGANAELSQLTIKVNNFDNK